MTVDAEMLTALLVETFDPKADYEVIAKGVPAAPGGAKGEVVFSATGGRRGRRGGPRRPSSSSAPTPTPTTSPASTPPRASSRASAARPATPRWSPAAWASRASPPPPSSRSTSRSACIRVGDHDDQGRRLHRHQRHQRRGHARRRPARRPHRGPGLRRDPRRPSRPSSAGPTTRAGSASATNADTPQDAKQGARAGRGGHRPVPHRAHVHGRGPPAEDAQDDHGRRRARRAKTRWRTCFRCSRRTSRACSRR